MLGRLLTGLTGLLLAGGAALAGGVVRAAPVAPALAAEPVAASATAPASTTAPAPATAPASTTAPAPATKLGTEWLRSMRNVPDFEVVDIHGHAPVPAPAPAVTTTTAAPPPIATHEALVTAVAAVERRRPVAVAIEDLGVAVPIAATGVDPETGQLALPADAETVVWYEHGASPGEEGSAVLAGHVDFNGRRGTFFDLGDVAVGSAVTVTYDDGMSTRFEVVDRHSHAKPDLPTGELFRRDGEPTLVLITCGGEFDRGARSYRSNVVVTARPIS